MNRSYMEVVRNHLLYNSNQAIIALKPLFQDLAFDHNARPYRIDKILHQTSNYELRCRIQQIEIKKRLKLKEMCKKCKW